MIRYVQGNLLEAPAEALVNTVNEVGVMGKGIALMFREAFPESAKLYEAAAKDNQVKVGHMFVTETGRLMGPRWIIHFPTKKHWRQPSQMEWVRSGLKDLVRVLRENKISSVALPPLGCGNGGLDWGQVRKEIEAAAAEVPDVEMLVHEPTREYYNAPKRAGVETLTPARALIAEMVRRYGILGLPCSVLEVQKLAWVLERSILDLGLDDPLELHFVANKYGPYADRLRHLLADLDGSYLHCERRLADARPLDLVWFEDTKREAVSAYLASDTARHLLPALDAASLVIDGFESPLGLELLATVGWLLSIEKTPPTLEALRDALEHWPGGRPAARRKLRLFDDRLLSLALARLRSAPHAASPAGPTSNIAH